MDDLVKSRQHKDAAESFKQLVQELDISVDWNEQRQEALDQFIYDMTEAAAEKSSRPIR